MVQQVINFVVLLCRRNRTDCLFRVASNFIEEAVNNRLFGKIVFGNIFGIFCRHLNQHFKHARIFHGIHAVHNLVPNVERNRLGTFRRLEKFYQITPIFALGENVCHGYEILQIFADIFAVYFAEFRRNRKIAFVKRGGEFFQNEEKVVSAESPEHRYFSIKCLELRDFFRRKNLHHVFDVFLHLRPYFFHAGIFHSLAYRLFRKRIKHRMTFFVKRIIYDHVLETIWIVLRHEHCFGRKNRLVNVVEKFRERGLRFVVLVKMIF